MFRNREAAGRRLATVLSDYAGTDAVVLALPRGGVPVGFEVARALRLPLDVIMVRKVGVPTQPELAAAALGEGGVRIPNERIMRSLGLTTLDLVSVERAAREELESRTRRFRGLRRPVALVGRTALIVDDGIATGSTARAACEVARARGASYVVLAVPVAPRDTVESMQSVADEVVCLEMPQRFASVGEHYEDFSQVSDDEVADLLRYPFVADDREGPACEATNIQVTGAVLPADLTVPHEAQGLVVFVHGSGSSRLSPRNRAVAKALNWAGFATLLFDLLTPAEARRRDLVFDIDLLADRLAEVTAWCGRRRECEGLRIGYFGASTGAAAALVAAARPDSPVAAVVSRGGRPDLAGPALPLVHAPTLFLVGGADREVLALNREAKRLLTGPSGLVIVPGATHLFEEPGALEQVERYAADWFQQHLASPEQSDGRARWSHVRSH